MNLALLTKQAWRILTQPESLVYEVSLNKYCHSADFMNCSWNWQDSLGFGKAFYAVGIFKKKGMANIIGMGNSTSIWTD